MQEPNLENNVAVGETMAQFDFHRATEFSSEKSRAAVGLRDKKKPRSLEASPPIQNVTESESRFWRSKTNKKSEVTAD